MIYARINVNVDTGVYLFLHISCGTEYSQHSNALAHPNPSANSNKFKLLPYHCYAKAVLATWIQRVDILCFKVHTDGMCRMHSFQSCDLCHAIRKIPGKT